MITKIQWHDFKKEGPLPDSRQVFITDGKSLGCAHFFAVTYGPPNYNIPRELNEFVNQHMRIVGNNYIETKNVTYWVDTKGMELPSLKKKRKVKAQTI